MELLYIWVEKYKNIEKQGFNFSPKYRFEFDTDKKVLKVEERENVIKNFFGDEKVSNIDGKVSNITAIVGANGAGKTTLLEIISRIPFRKKQGSDKKKQVEYEPFLEESDFILIFYNDGKFCTEYKLTRYPPEISLYNGSKKFADINRENNNISIIYHSNIYTRQGIIIDSNDLNSFDISTEKFTSSQKKEIKDGSGTRFQVNDVLNQAKFLDKNEELDYIPKNILELPEFLMVSFGWIGTVRAKIDKDIKDQPKAIETLNRFRDVNKLFYAYLLFKLKKYTKAEDKSNYLKKIEEYRDKSFVQDKEDWLEYLEKTTEWTNDKYEDGKYYFDFKTAIAYIDLQKKHLDTVLDKSSGILNNWVFSKGTKASKLSTGQFFFLELFARLYLYLFTIQQSENKNLIFLFDEVDLGFHPAWQRRIINILISSLSKMFPKKEIQIFVTSHSPFIVSDLPNENVIFLTKEEKTGNCIVKDSLNDMKKTFGANIHTLLSDSFFMESLMGEFAKLKIDGVIQFLNNDTSSIIKNQEDAEKIINMIGEPVIKRYLQKELANKRLKKVDEIEDKIKKLQDQIDELKNLKKQAK